MAAVLTAAAPRFMSPVPEGTDVEDTRTGMRMLGFGADHEGELFPQSMDVGQLLGARDGEGGALYKFCVIEIGRRATKSTSIMATIIGRAMRRPGYKCVVTAQSGTIASSIILEHGELLENKGYAGYKRRSFAGDDEPEGDGTMRLLRNGGRERIEFKNGSRIWCVPPNASAVRSKAADDIWIDEGGEHEGEKGEAFLKAVQPLMDTRGELAQLIVSGTPGIARTGMFWDLLQDGYDGEDVDQGTLDYSASDIEAGELDARPWDELDEDEKEREREVWRRVHPGPSSRKPDGSTLTSIRTLERRRKKLGATQFAREYLCVWPADAATSAVDMDAWKAAERDAPQRPEKYAWAYDVAPDSSSAAVAAAWRDEDGNAWVEIMDHRLGTDWLPTFIKGVSKVQRIPIVWDGIGANHDPANLLDAMRPKVRNVSLHYKKGVVPAEAAFIRELNAGRMRHSGQAPLNDALDGAYWRQAEGYRLWGRKPDRGDITPAVAAALALHRYDTDVVRRGTGTGLSGMFD